jgi:hypothetical protein
MLSAIEELGRQEKHPVSVVSKNPAGRALSRKALTELSNERDRRRAEKRATATKPPKEPKPAKAEKPVKTKAEKPVKTKAEKPAKGEKAPKGAEPREKRAKPGKGNGSLVPQPDQTPGGQGDPAKAQNE